MAPIYNHADEIPDDVKAELVDGFVLMAKKLREWRGHGFHELRAQILAADGTITLICHHDDRVSMIDHGGPAVDITEIIDRAEG